MLGKSDLLQAFADGLSRILPLMPHRVATKGRVHVIVEQHNPLLSPFRPSPKLDFTPSSPRTSQKPPRNPLIINYLLGVVGRISS